MRDKRRFYVVVLSFNGVPHYLESEKVGLLDPKTHATIREPMGFFCTDVKHARKFGERWQAEAVSAGYEGAHVETIKGGERLK